MTEGLKEILETILEHGDQVSDHVLFFAMFAGSLLEYIFPPVPGDLWTAAGAILIARGHGFLPVFLGVNIGSAAGFLLDYAFGWWLSNPQRQFRHWGPRWERLGRGIDSVAAGFDRHPAFYLVVNRFLPGVRAFFFVAAGFGRVPLWKVLTFGLLSSVAWNLLLIAAGYAVGRQFDRLIDWMEHYTWGAWVVLAVVVIVIAVRFLRRKRKAADSPGPAGGGSPPKP